MILVKAGNIKVSENYNNIKIKIAYLYKISNIYFIKLFIYTFKNGRYLHQYEYTEGKYLVKKTCLCLNKLLYKTCHKKGMKRILIRIIKIKQNRKHTNYNYYKI